MVSPRQSIRTKILTIFLPMVNLLLKMILVPFPIQFVHIDFLLHGTIQLANRYV